MKMGEGLHFNKFFPGSQIAMPPPLADGQVVYADGTKASVDRMARDVTAFLMWTAEPRLEDRHRLGLKVILFLVVLTGFFIVAKRKIWADLH
jgi:cytochrome c1